MIGNKQLGKIIHQNQIIIEKLDSTIIKSDYRDKIVCVLWELSYSFGTSLFIFITAGLFYYLNITDFFILLFASFLLHITEIGKIFSIPGYCDYDR